MKPKKLLKRLKSASYQMTLRDLASTCNVSYETVRKILKCDDITSITLITYNKIDAGLKKYGL